MCGIVGYVGNRLAGPVILEGLRRVKYRGYDSAGIALLNNGEIPFCKQAGKIDDLERTLNQLSFFKKIPSTIGIGHTRWATHGAATDSNAHPHFSCDARIAVVHNGIVENHEALRAMLVERGHIFASETDTEVIAHLIEEIRKTLNGDPLEVVRTALAEIKGTYGLAVIFADYPQTLVFARHGSPLRLGFGKDEFWVASDAISFRAFTDQEHVLEEGQMGIIRPGITPEGYYLQDMNKIPVSPKIETIKWTLEQIEKGSYSHFMLKEIFEQPTSLRSAMAGRINENGLIKLGGPENYQECLKAANHHLLVAAGTSSYAAMVGEILLQEVAKVSAQAKNASELANQKFPCFPPETIGWVVSQSGETADVLGAMGKMKDMGLDVMAICNVVGSSVTREALTGVYIHAGPEIGVASTKAFTAQVLVLHLISLFLRQLRGVVEEKWLGQYLEDLRGLPEKVEMILGQADQIKTLAEKYSGYLNFLFLGRGINHPTANEGALKLKEISYRHAEGYAMGEMKHGPLALIDENFPTVVLVPENDDCYKKILSNINEIKARGGPIIAIANEGDKEIGKLVTDVIYIPATTYYLTPILMVIPLQLFAYYLAVKLGRNVDQPRNLAKAVTVE